MEPKPILEFSNRNELRNRLMQNHNLEREVWGACNRSGKPYLEGLPYLDVVYGHCVSGGLIRPSKRTQDSQK